MAGVRVRVIPAMTAAQAVASRVGAPLGHDYAVISLSDRLKPWDVIAARLTAAAAADLVLAIYNPASVTRTWQVGAMRELLLAHRDPGIPVVIGRNVSGPVSGPNEDVRVVKLADLNPAEIDMRCLLIVGSSQTRWYSVDSQDRVFTRAAIPRRAELPRQSRAATATERACGRIPQGRPGCLRKARQFAPRTRQSPESCGDRQPAAERPTGRGWAPCANPAKHIGAGDTATRAHQRYVIERGNRRKIDRVLLLGSVTTARHKEMGSVQGLQTFHHGPGLDLG